MTYHSRLRWFAESASNASAGQPASRVKRGARSRRSRPLILEWLEDRRVLSVDLTLGAAVAGNVADSDADTFGDNVNSLPGSGPVFVSAGVLQAGGAGSNGTVRIHSEWDITSFPSTSLESAEVLLNTNRGATDSVDTFFFYGTAEGNGTLEVTDFETPATQISGVMMPVTGTVGVDGTFTLDVTAALQSAITAGFNYFTLQGRVDESSLTAARGLQVRSTAAGNLTSDLEPQLTASFADPIDLEVSVTESNDPVIAGSTNGNLAYFVTLSNSGPTDATAAEVAIDLTLPAGVVITSVTPESGSYATTTAPDGTWTVDVPSGTSTTLSVLLTAYTSAADGTDVISIGATATAGAGQEDTNGVNDADSETSSVVHVIDVAVFVTESADPVIVGFSPVDLTYVVTVDNVGTAAVTGVEVSDVLTLSSGVTVSSITPSAGSFSGSTWTVGDLANFATTTLPAAINDSTTSIAVADAGNFPAVDGSSGTIDFYVRIEDEIVAVRDVSGNSLTVDRGAQGTSASAHAADSFVSVITSATLTVVLSVSPATASGSDVIVNAASLSAVDQTETAPPLGTGSANNLASEATSVAHPVDLAIGVSESTDPVTAGSGAGNLTYVVTIENIGETDATGVEVLNALSLPPGVSVDSVTPSGGTFTDPVWSVGSLASDASATLTIVLTVSGGADAGSNVIGNAATLAFVNETDYNAANNDDAESTSVVVGAFADLAVSVSEVADPIVAGSGTGNLTYVVTVANVGSAAATGVEINEDLLLPSGVSIDSVTPSAGTYMTTTAPDGTWSVGTLASGASATLTIVLTVDGTTEPGVGVVGSTATLTAPADSNASNDVDDEFTEVLAPGSFIPIKISGTVFRDLNASAAFESGTDAPLSGGVVTLIVDGNDDGVVDDIDTDPVIDVQLSAPGTGAYSFENLGAEQYFVLFAPGDGVQTSPATSAYYVVASSGVNVPGRDFGSFLADAGGPYAVDEGLSVQLDGSGGAGFTTFAANITFTWDLDGDGTFGETGGAAARGDEVGVMPTFNASGLTAPSSHTVRLRVTNNNFSQTDEDTAVVNVVKRVDEGTALTLTGAVPPGTVLMRINWDDGMIDSIASPGATYSQPHTYADNGQYAVIVTFIDGFGARTDQTLPVLVENVDPALASLPNLTNVAEGAFIALPPATFSDPGFDNPLNTNPSNGGETAETFTATINWGDGTSEPLGDITIVKTPGSPGVLTTGTIQAAHAYADNGVYTATVTVFDDDGGSDFESFQVTVVNVNPTVTSFVNSSPVCGGTMEGSPISVTAVFSDPGFDNALNIGGELTETFTATINWDDGTTSPPLPVTVTSTSGSEGVLSVGTVTASHTYVNGGIYRIEIKVHDDDGGVNASATTTMIIGAGVNNNVLHVVGTNSADHVSINKQGNGLFKVHADFFQGVNFKTFPTAGVELINVVLCGGNDHLNIAGNISTRAIIDGGPGSDNLPNNNNSANRYIIDNGELPYPPASGDQLGTVSNTTISGINLSGFDRSFGFEAAHTGTLTLAATFAPANTAQLVLLDAGGNVLANSVPISGGARIDFDSAAGEQHFAVAGDHYTVLVLGTNSNVNLTIQNMLTVNSPLTVHGTEGDDTFSFVAGDILELTVNGVRYLYDAASVGSVTFQGNGGNDAAQFVVPSADDVAALAADAADLVGEGFAAFARGTEQIDISIAAVAAVFQNEALVTDVNGDSFTSPSDALVVINLLNEHGSRSALDMLAQGWASAGSFRFDVTGDNYLAPLDALLIINALNNPLLASAEGEGPGGSPSDNLPAALDGDESLVALDSPRLTFMSAVRAVDQRETGLASARVFRSASLPAATTSDHDALFAMLASPPAGRPSDATLDVESKESDSWLNDDLFTALAEDIAELSV